jgi:hypothetical protein
MDKKHRIVNWAITSFLIILLVGSGYLSVYNLRQNNLEMLRLREAVFTADREDGDINEALLKLQNFVVSHMNTTLPKLGDQKAIQLKYTYERKVAAEDSRVAAARTTLNSEATEYCQKTYPTSSFTVRSQCVQDYFTAHPVKDVEIPVELYSYDFFTPLWVPDLAGLSLLVSAILAVALLFKLLSWLIVRRSTI